MSTNYYLKKIYESKDECKRKLCDDLFETDKVSFCTYSEFINIVLPKWDYFRFFKFLMEEGISINPASGEPLQEYIDKGYFRKLRVEYAVEDSTVYIKETTIILSNGIRMLLKRLENKKYVH